jgi:hypothetical protein
MALKQKTGFSKKSVFFRFLLKETRFLLWFSSLFSKKPVFFRFLVKETRFLSPNGA